VKVTARQEIGCLPDMKESSPLEEAKEDIERGTILNHH
jgi:hypothetical protein